MYNCYLEHIAVLSGFNKMQWSTLINLFIHLFSSDTVSPCIALNYGKTGYNERESTWQSVHGAKQATASALALHGKRKQTKGRSA
jgi:hypothetical protein